jgi:8-oxo-dGTP diphosphatase
MTSRPGSERGPTAVERDQVADLPRHVIGVAAVVIDDDGRVLTVRRHTPPRWELPGGALEAGETLHEGVVREVREEVGLDVEPVRLTGVYQNMALGPTALVFWCRRVGGSERPSDETTDWRWVRRDELPDLMPPAWSMRFTDALDVHDAERAGDEDGAEAAVTAGAGGCPGLPVRAHDGQQLL